MEHLGGSSDLRGESKGSDTEMDVSLVSELQPENISESVIVPSSTVAVKEGKIECLSESGPARSIMLGDASEALVSDKMVVSEVDTFVPEGMLENLPSSSLTKEQESTEGSSEKGQDGSSVQLEESTGKEDEMGHLMETPRYSGDLLVKKSVDSEEEVQRLSKKDPISSSVALLESVVSEPETSDHSDASKAGMVPLEYTMAEDVDLPASSLEIEGRVIDHPSEVLDGSSVTEGPKTPVADKDTQMNAPDACEREPEVVCESVDMPLVTSTMVDDGVKGSSEAVPIGSSKSPEELESEAKIFDASHVCVELPENVSESMDQTPVILINQGDSVEGLSEAIPVGSTESPESSKSKAKVADASQVSGTIPEVASENVDQPPVNMAVEGDKIEGLSEAGPMGSLETPEESKSEAKVGDTCQVSGTMQENASEDMDIQPSLTAEEGEKVELPAEGSVGGSPMEQP